MKNLIVLLVVIPSALAVFLFGAAIMSFDTPWLLDAAVSGPWFAIVCIIFGVAACIPLLIFIISSIISAISRAKSRNKEDNKN